MPSPILRTRTLSKPISFASIHPDKLPLLLHTTLFRTIDLGRIDDIPNKPIPINNREKKRKREGERIKTEKKKKREEKIPWSEQHSSSIRTSLITKQLGQIRSEIPL